MATNDVRLLNVELQSNRQDDLIMDLCKRTDQVSKEFCEEQELRGQLQEEAERRIDALQSDVDNLRMGECLRLNNEVSALRAELAESEEKRSRQRINVKELQEQVDAMRECVEVLRGIDGLNVTSATFNRIQQALAKLDEAQKGVSDGTDKC